jgi:hypothetical protein
VIAFGIGGFVAFDAVVESLFCSVDGEDGFAEDGDDVGAEIEIAVYLEAEFDWELE